MMKKRLLALILTLAMAISLLQTSALAVELEGQAQGAAVEAAAAATNSGTCGENLTWSYNADNRTLTIQGKGAMYNYDEWDAPWEDYDERVRTLTIGSGVTTIGNEAFEGFEYLTQVTLPDSLVTIGTGAFEECERLTDIKIPKGVTSIRSVAFEECNALEKIYFYGSAPSFGANCFEAVVATAYYPSGDSTWTSEKKQNYGGRLTWQSWSPNGSKPDPEPDPEPTPVQPVELTTPALDSISNNDEGIKVTWKKVSGAAGYYVYRKSSGTDWKRIGTVQSGSTLSYTDKKAKDGSTYTYTIRAYDASGNKSGYNKTGKTMKRLDTPDLEDARNAASSITVRWDKEKGAEGYYIYRKAGSATKWSRVAKVKGGNTEKWSDEDVTNGTKYVYTVRAYSGSYTSGYEKEGEEIYRLSRTSISSLKSNATKKMTVKWKANSKASGYQIEYSRQKDFDDEDRVTVTSKDTTSKTISGLKKGKKYYVRVRSYKKVAGERYYSAWSSVKTVTVK